MKNHTLSQRELQEFIETNIQSFHKKRIEKLNDLKIETLLKRKNPYLFKAKNQNTSQDLIKNILDAYLSSQEEGIFGNFLEQLAIFVCERSFGGRKSTTEGIDLEFEKDNVLYIVSIKSGPNWGNSSQIKKMMDFFNRAKKIRGSNLSKSKIVAVNGCCYGKEKSIEKGEYLKLCGQEFWEFISGIESFYIDIIEPLGHKAKERNSEFQKEYDKVINKFTLSFSKNFCSEDGSILWEKLIQFNSGK